MQIQGGRSKKRDQQVRKKKVKCCLRTFPGKEGKRGGGGRAKAGQENTPAE